MSIIYTLEQIASDYKLFKAYVSVDVVDDGKPKPKKRARKSKFAMPMKDKLAFMTEEREFKVNIYNGIRKPPTDLDFGITFRRCDTCRINWMFNGGVFEIIEAGLDAGLDKGEGVTSGGKDGNDRFSFRWRVIGVHRDPF